MDESTAVYHSLMMILQIDYCTFEVYHIGVSASVVCVGVARTGFDLAIISCAIDWPLTPALSCANSVEVQSTSSVWC